MKKEEMVVGRLYFTQEIEINGYEYIGHGQGVETVGSFEDSNGVRRRLYYSSMSEPRLEFQLDDSFVNSLVNESTKDDKSVSFGMLQNKINLLEEDIESAHMFLDNKNVKRYFRGKELSLVGRITRYKKSKLETSHE
mgnify:CR=1 FL=1|tara:strand:- start:424 stop:834 length:411 start_codon:yes stop_codon:yes gene_type:complete